MKKQILLSAVGVSLISLGIAGSADAALVGRLAATTGGTDYQAYYDDVADLTWLADANAAGGMTWVNANAWAAGLSIDGVTGWRLPTTMQPDASCSTQITIVGTSLPIQGAGTGCTGSEMGHLFYVEDINSTTPGPFSNVQPKDYWSGTEFAGDPTGAWFFFMRDGNGNQNVDKKSKSWFAWAVQSGDVSAVPVPAAVWLFGSGLLGLVGVARRKSANI